jgi:acetolactate synthase regulatory subunit
MTPHLTATPTALAPRPCAPSVLTLEVRDAPDVLVRVLTRLRARQCAITHVDYVARDRHRPGRLVVGIEPPRARSHCVEAWLLNLVDVLSVEVEPAP